MFCWEKENWNNFDIMFPLWFEFCTLVGYFRIIPLVIHALNDNDDEIDDNDNDDKYNENDDVDHASF